MIQLNRLLYNVNQRLPDWRVLRPHPLCRQGSPGSLPGLGRSAQGWPRGRLCCPGGQRPRSGNSCRWSKRGIGAKKRCCPWLADRSRRSAWLDLLQRRIEGRIMGRLLSNRDAVLKKKRKLKYIIIVLKLTNGHDILFFVALVPCHLKKANFQKAHSITAQFACKFDNRL